MYNTIKYSEEMATARMEDPRGADSPNWRPEADGESTPGVRPAEEQAVTDMTVTSLLWSGVRAVTAPFWSCLGHRGTTLEDCVEDIVITGGEHSESDCQSAYKQMNATSFIDQTDSATQNGGSRFPGRPRGPIAESSANAKLTRNWPEAAPTGEPRPDGGYSAKAAAAPSWTVTHSAPVLSQPISLWDPPLISTRGSGFQLCPVGMNPAERSAGEATALLPKVVPAAGVVCGKKGYFARKAAARNRLGLAPKAEPHPVGDKGTKAVAAPSRTERGAASIKGHPIPLWDPPIIATTGGGFQLCQTRAELNQGVADNPTPVDHSCGTSSQNRPVLKVAPTKTMACSPDVNKMVSTQPYAVPGGVLVIRVAGAETVVGLCLQCRLPGGTMGTAARCPQCGTQYLWPMPTFVPIQTNDPPGDTARLSAESPGALWTKSADPGEWGSEPVNTAGSEEHGAIGQATDREKRRRSPRSATPSTLNVDSSDEGPKELSSTLVWLVAVSCGGNGVKRPLTGSDSGRSRVSPVERRPERRSPSVPGVGGTSGDGRSTPNLRTGKDSPCFYQAPVLTLAEEGPCQARTAHVGAGGLPDILVQEEIPHGGPSQDGGTSASGGDVVSGGGSGAAGRRSPTLRRSGSGSRSTRKTRSQRRTEEGETQPAVSPLSSTGQSDNGERVGTTRLPTAYPYAQPHALDNAPVTCSWGSSSSLGVSEGSLGVGENRTGERLGSFASEGGSRGGGQLGHVSKSRWVPEEADVQSEEMPKHERWSRPRSAGISGVCSWAGTDEGDSLESGPERPRETRWWAPLFEGYVRWMDRTRFLLEKDDVVDYWWAKGEFTPAERKKELQFRWFLIGRNENEPMGPDMLSDPVDADEPLSWVLPGRAGNANLTRCSRAERAITAKYKYSHGLEYPYVPEPLMQEIEVNRDQWLRETIEEYMVNKGGAITGSKAEERIEHLIRVWSIGRSVYKHKVVYRPERGLLRSYSVTVLDMGGREVKKPDPRHYY
ncbi:uncharacterized protein LOC142490008 [Ascaphus truei]|uniref:uncharacterized protein LOC142490008 n=1 Tax=Ascaphus truei TaxID=8439 RepID=UPI003F59258A